jgi:hypothetical protein
VGRGETGDDADENKEPRRCREGVVSEQRLHNKLPSPQAVGTSAVARGGFLNKKRDPAGDRARKFSRPPLKLLVSAERTHDASRAFRSRRRLPQHCGRTASPSCPHARRPTVRSHKCRPAQARSQLALHALHSNEFNHTARRTVPRRREARELDRTEGGERRLPALYNVSVGGEDVRSVCGAAYSACDFA